MNNRLICVFCGSSAGKGKQYTQEAKVVGNLLADLNHGLVYGGASIGVMGAIADQVLARQGRVIGVIPQSLMDWEVGHQGLTQLEVVDSMHQRKQRMYVLSDAFLALPGGMGTLDELCEIITWAQLRYHQKPTYVYNASGFFDSMLEHFRRCHQEGFLSAEHLALAREVKSIDELREALSKV
jgi:uncharacterized protein (TIGR00730 family)